MDKPTRKGGGLHPGLLVVANSLVWKRPWVLKSHW